MLIKTYSGERNLMKITKSTIDRTLFAHLSLRWLIKFFVFFLHQFWLIFKHPSPPLLLVLSRFEWWAKKWLKGNSNPYNRRFVFTYQRVMIVYLIFSERKLFTIEISSVVVCRMQIFFHIEFIFSLLCILYEGKICLVHDLSLIFFFILPIIFTNNDKLNLELQNR